MITTVYADPKSYLPPYPTACLSPTYDITRLEVGLPKVCLCIILSYHRLSIIKPWYDKARYDVVCLVSLMLCYTTNDKPHFLIDSSSYVSPYMHFLHTQLPDFITLHAYCVRTIHMPISSTPCFTSIVSYT